MPVRLYLSCTFFFATSCLTPQIDNDNCTANLDFAVQQTELLYDVSAAANKLPRALNADGTMYWAHDNFDWTEGFFPGTCWYLYEYTKDTAWANRAVALQGQYAGHRFLTNNHDLGFVFNCSYGNGYRLLGDPAMKQVLADAGNSLVARFNPVVGCIKSWDVDRGWQSERDWQFPVIIDNMMNLELLFELTRLTGDSGYHKVAVAHANTTLENHFRDDHSSYHVVDYDPATGAVRSKQKAQGYSHESAWSRGQAWGLYGYTVCYRYTNDQKYLDKAIQIAGYITGHPKMPADHVPYWDYDAPKIPNEPRDASAASITASALIELNGYLPSQNKYLDEAKFILKSLSSEEYRAKAGENGNFILKHSVGSIPHGSEIDVPIIYADYYYVEALIRLRRLDPNF